VHLCVFVVHACGQLYVYLSDLPGLKISDECLEHGVVAHTPALECVQAQKAADVHDVV